MAQGLDTSPRDDESSWSNARQFASLVQPIPGSVTQALQALWSNHIEISSLGSEDIYPTSIESLRRVDRTAKLKTPIYFAATTLFPAAFDKIQTDDSVQALLQILRPGLFASFLCLVYLHRRLNKLCENRDDWPTISKEFIAYMELGYNAGLKVQEIGPALGTLICGIRHVALSSLLLWTPAPFKKYRKSSRRRILPQMEHDTWGCDTAQISAALLRDLQFRNDIYEVTAAFRGETLEELPADLQLWSALLCWVDAAHAGAQLSPQKAALLNIPAEAIEELSTKAQQIDAGKGDFSWMLKASTEGAADESEEAAAPSDE